MRPVTQSEPRENLCDPEDREVAMQGCTEQDRTAEEMDKDPGDPNTYVD